jgi:hypothetical protein
MLVMRAESTSSARAKDAAPVSDAIRAREQGLSLLHRANRWLIGLAILLAGALTGLTAHAFHAHSATAQAATTTPSQSSGDDSSGASASAPQLQSPANPPAVAAPASAPAAPVVSGGS